MFSVLPFLDNFLKINHKGRWVEGGMGQEGADTQNL